jgi:hypothetical protein
MATKLHVSPKDLLLANRHEIAYMSKVDRCLFRKSGHRRAFLNSTAVCLFDF